MNQSPVVTDFRMTPQGILIATFEGRTAVTFAPRNSRSRKLEAIVVTHAGRQIAFCNVLLWRSMGGALCAEVFGGTVDAETAKLVGEYCLAAYDKLREDSTSGEPLSPDDHVRALGITKAGYDCYKAMMG